MKQITQNYRSGELTVADVPPPALRPGGVLVAVAASLVSAGTERAMVTLAQASLLDKARQRPDLARQVLEKVRQEGLLTTYQKVMTRLDSLSPLGYSCAGTVIAVGEGVADLQVGDAVACAGAGYANHAEVVFIPRNLAVKIPPFQRPDPDSDPSHPQSKIQNPKSHIFEEAAFTTVGAIALQGLRQATPTLGETVIVIGLGLIGLITVQLLRANGCRVLGMDLSPARCELALRFGAIGAAASDEDMRALVARHTGGLGVDAALITASTSSSAPLRLAAELCRDRGRVVAVGLVGLNVPRKLFYDKELDLRLSRSYGPGRYDPSYEEQGHDYPIGYVRWTENRNMQAFLDLLAEGRVQVAPLITHRFPIAEAERAYALITGERASEALGVVINYPETDSAARLAPVVRLERPGAAPATRLGVARAGRGVPNARPVALGLIGAGAFAQGALLPALASVPGAPLRAVASATGLSARHVAARYGAAYCTAEASRILEDPEVDAVLVATRHGSHAALVIRAIAAGKPVFVEKPLAVSEEQLGAVVTAYEAAQQRAEGAPNGALPAAPPLLLVGFNRRFAPLAVTMRDFLAGAGPLMMHYRVNAGFVPASSWLHDPAEGGGRIVGEVCHFVDLLQFLCGADPVSVAATAAQSPSGALQEDNVSIHIRFSDGSVGSILYAAGGDKAFPKERVEIFGGGRVAALDDFRTLELARNGKRRVERTLLRQDKGHAAELRAFVEAVRAGGPAPIPFASLVLTTRVTFLAREAIHSGRELRV
ncbi:MAG: bi-domain-containing oxidoreductase [Oscillochloridaceae bacterium]|nr:bi-domain-containing oxidoreductase [Chloroflexaceae bacterium]MDW8388719.1 bi-domain-containing oxidoreductase [Oscillochloridaceae bacterium]